MLYFFKKSEIIRIFFYLTRWKINLSNVLKLAGGSSSSTLYIA